jgi:hypothetical protein
MVLRLGVTGHRSLEHEDDVRREVNLTIDRELAARRNGLGPAHAIELTAVSALAEGADRLVVHECLRRSGSTLMAVLPLPIAEYAKDFLTADSRHEFTELLTAATSVSVAEAMPTRPQAYERAGQLMVDRSDVVIAVWDGLPARGIGGTADIVAYAQARQVPVLHIHVPPAQR